jgi:hypothetical protein
MQSDLRLWTIDDFTVNCDYMREMRKFFFIFIENFLTKYVSFPKNHMFSKSRIYLRAYTKNLKRFPSDLRTSRKRKIE